MRNWSLQSSLSRKLFVAIVSTAILFAGIGQINAEENPAS
ncbi:hypothetical protein SAMN05443246_0263 [Paenibacillus sp. GP183]|nr:hypothetical protein SAMN05443246_0263 [Paenibacillus sp. GP183]